MTAPSQKVSVSLFLSWATGQVAERAENDGEMERNADVHRTGFARWRQAHRHGIGEFPTVVKSLADRSHAEGSD